MPAVQDDLGLGKEAKAILGKYGPALEEGWVL